MNNISLFVEFAIMLQLHVADVIADNRAYDVVYVQGGVGSAAAVSLIGCQQACGMAQPECDAIAYNAKLQACFLKQNPSGDTCQVRNPCTVEIHDHCAHLAVHWSLCAQLLVCSRPSLDWHMQP